MTATHDVAADIAATTRTLYRGQIATEAVTKALAAMAEYGTDAAADVLRSYHDRYGWLLDGAA